MLCHSFEFYEGLIRLAAACKAGRPGTARVNTVESLKALLQQHMRVSSGTRLWVSVLFLQPEHIRTRPLRVHFTMLPV
jgi:hypothetical protein